jgi:hypothetical protein
MDPAHDAFRHALKEPPHVELDKGSPMLSAYLRAHVIRDQDVEHGTAAGLVLGVGPGDAGFRGGIDELMNSLGRPVKVQQQIGHPAYLGRYVHGAVQKAGGNLKAVCRQLLGQLVIQFQGFRHAPVGLWVAHPDLLQVAGKLLDGRFGLGCGTGRIDDLAAHGRCFYGGAIGGPEAREELHIWKLGIDLHLRLELGIQRLVPGDTIQVIVSHEPIAGQPWAGGYAIWLL